MLTARMIAAMTMSVIEMMSERDLRRGWDETTGDVTTSLPIGCWGIVKTIDDSLVWHEK